MPSVDSTGKRISGAEQRARAEKHKAARAKVAAAVPDLTAALPEFRGLGADTDADPQPIHINPPPLDGTVADGICWAAQLQVKAARHAAAGLDPARVRAVISAVKAIGAVKVAAADSERAVTTALAYLGLAHDYAADEPPPEPAGYVLWAFWRLLVMAYEVATQGEEVDEGQVAHRARSLAMVAQVQPQRAIDDLAARAEAAAAEGNAPELRVVA